MNIFKRAIDGTKNIAKDLAIQVALNHLLGDIGSLSGLSVDRELKRIKGTLALTGENAPVDVTIEGWELGLADQPNRIRALAITTSRPWLTAIAQRAIVGRWVEIPAVHMGKIKLALES
jgi:hypothetical protein